jgi:hypothetical protein
MSGTRSWVRKEFDDKGYYLTRGAAIGLFCSWATWPLGYIYTTYTFPDNVKTYRQLLRATFTVQELIELNRSFWRTGWAQNIGKAYANGGVIDLVDSRLAPRYHWTATQTGAVAATLCAPAEVISTTFGQIATVRSFIDKQKGISFRQQAQAFTFYARMGRFFENLFTIQSGRILTASFARSE